MDLISSPLGALNVNVNLWKGQRNNEAPRRFVEG